MRELINEAHEDGFCARNVIGDLFEHVSCSLDYKEVTDNMLNLRQLEV